MWNKNYDNSLSATKLEDKFISGSQTYKCSARHKTNANHVNLDVLKYRKEWQRICFVTLDPRVGLKSFITSLKNLFNPTRGSRVTNKFFAALFYTSRHLNFHNWHLLCVDVLQCSL